MATTQHSVKRVLCSGHEDVLCVVCLNVPTCVWIPGNCRLSNVKWPPHSTPLGELPCSGHEDDDTLVSKCSSSLNLLSVCTCLAIETASLHTLAWLGLHTCTLTDMSMSMFVHMCVYVCV